MEVEGLGLNPAESPPRRRESCVQGCLSMEKGIYPSLSVPVSRLDCMWIRAGVGRLNVTLCTFMCEPGALR